MPNGTTTEVQYHYSFAQHGIVDTALLYYFCAKFEEDILPNCKYRVCPLLQAPGLGCTETKLLLMIL